MLTQQPQENKNQSSYLGRYGDLWLDFGAFAVTAFLVFTEGWTAGQLVWSLWFASLTFGFAIIAVWTVRCVLRGPKDGLFLSGFFVFHYGLFHFVHAQFLRIFLGLPDGSGADSAGGLSPFGLVGIVTLPLIGFAALTICTRQREVLSAWTAESLGDVMSYGRVMKMHFMIFALAGAQAVELDGTWFLIIVLLFHFFPLETVKFHLGRLTSRN